jgi:hypothetical protein
MIVVKVHKKRVEETEAFLAGEYRGNKYYLEM